MVEDDDDVRAYTAEILRELGYQVIEAHDGPTALRILERADRKVDLLFTDVIMPGMNGRDLTKVLVFLCPGLHHLFMSGYTADVIAHNGLLDEGLRFIHKPFTKVALAAKIREALDG